MSTNINNINNTKWTAEHVRAADKRGPSAANPYPEHAAKSDAFMPTALEMVGGKLAAEAGSMTKRMGGQAPTVTAASAPRKPGH